MGLNSRGTGWAFYAFSRYCCAVFFLWSSARATFQETTEYLPVPEAAKPLEGLLPDKGVEPERGLLQVNSAYLHRKHVVNFDTREVEIVEYVRIGGSADTGGDSTTQWQAYYQELNSYTTDMYDLLLRKRWLLQFIAQDEASPGGTPSTWVFDLPFRVPDWMRRVGVDKPKLSINGSYQLTMDGSRKTGSGVGFTSGWFPNLHMNQNPKFSVKGSIGRLISVEINSEDGLNTNLKEQLKISYKGEGDELEDDVIQEIEAGNTSLSLTGTNLTGYTENHKGLFGLKMRMKLGDLEMTTIASQEGGTQEKQKLGVGTEARQFDVEDKAIDFYKHFWLSIADRRDYENPSNWDGSFNKYVLGGKNRRPLQVYQLLQGNELQVAQDSLTACAYDENGKKTDKCETGIWKTLVEGTDYTYDEDLRMLNVPGGFSEITLAARWQGDFIAKATGSLYLEGKDKILIYSRNRKNDPLLDSLMWRNVYAITRVTAQDRDQFQLTLVDNDGRDRAPGDTISYIRRLGLEKRDQPGKLDFDNTLTFKLDDGFIVLPCLTNGLAGGDPGNCMTPMKRVRPQVSLYTATEEEIQNGPSASKFTAFGKQRQSTFDVHQNSVSANGQQCFDISPGTERLVLNGSTILQKDLDYDVVYESGQITLTSARARDPNASLDITYECNPAFQIQDKVLLGTRLEYKLDGISDQSLLGATVLYKSQTITEKQPELGHEPFNQFLFGFNARLAGEPKWMTRFANLFPLVHTEAASKANFEFEIAHSIYNPNTKNSAYLDNFDFSQNTLPLSMTLYSWFKASPPMLGDDGLPDPTLDYQHQGLLVWHSSSTMLYDHIFGNTGNSYTNSQELPILKLSLTPNDNLEGNSWGGIMRAFTQGFSNQSRKSTLEIVVNGNEGTLYADLGKISEAISIPGLDDAKPNNSIIISEAVDTKTGVLQASNDCGLDHVCSTNGGKETGVRWECKPTCIKIPVRGDDPGQDDYHAPTSGSTEEDYRVNGTEQNNTGSALNHGFDTEDLDNSNTLDTVNHYIRFAMSLDSACTPRFYCEELQPGWRKYEIPLYGGGKVLDPTNTETELSLLSNLKMIRLWMGHLPKRVAKSELMLARVGLVGNSWEEGNRNTDFQIDANRFGSGDLGDSTYIAVPPTVLDSNHFRVDVINKQEDVNYKQAPSTPQEIDTHTQAPLPERALVLHYENLHPNEQVYATRLLSSDPKDLTQYARLSISIHGDSNWVKQSSHYDRNQNRVSFALRLGRDLGNRDSRDYYEVRLHMDTTLQQTDPDQANLWRNNSFTVNIADLTGLKNDPLYRSYDGRLVEHKAWNSARQDSSLTLAVVGDPTLARIDWMRLVIYVDSLAPALQKGDIWVNDLRLEGINRATGTAMRSQIQLDFADFINVSGNLQYTNGDFTTLSQAKTTPANSQSTVDYNSNVSLYANKFLPDAWGVSLPISLQYHGALDRPFTRPYSDLGLYGTSITDITRDLFDGRLSSIHDSTDSLNDINNRYARVYQSVLGEQRFSISYKKEMRTKSFLTRTLFERPEIEYNFFGTQHTQYYTETETRDYKVKLRYNLSPSENPSYRPMGFSEKWKAMPSAVSGLAVTPLPDKFNLILADYSFVRSFTLNKPRNPTDPIQFVPPQYNVELSHGVDLEWKPFSFFNFGYRIDVNRDLDNDHHCFESETFFDPDPSHCEGLFAKNVIFDWDEADGRPQTYWQHSSATDSSQVDTAHYGSEYGILARERNRNQTFHSDLNLSPFSWLTAGVGFNSGYRHTWTNAQTDPFGAGVLKPSHFEANADHDVKLTTGINPSSLLSSLSFGGFAKTMDAAKKTLDAYRVRNLDLTYTVSNKFNNEAFTYAYLRDPNHPVAWNNLMAYQMGFLYNPRNLATLFDGEPSPEFFDYLSAPDPALGPSQMNHLVNRSVDLQSGFSVPVMNLDLTGNLKYSRQYTLYRAFLPSDTTIAWPEYTISASFGDFAGKLPGVRSILRSLTAYSNYTYRDETKFDLFSQLPDDHSTTYNWNPLLRLTATTLSDVRAEISFTGMYEHEILSGKDAGLDTARPLTYLGANQPVLPIYHIDPTKISPKHTVSVGAAPTLSWDLETQKGIQFWRYYIKLKNNLRITINSSINYILSEIEEGGHTTKDKNQISAMVKPEASYNFTNNVDAKFWTQYKFDQFYNTPRDEYVHDLEVHGEFTMRF